MCIRDRIGLIQIKPKRVRHTLIERQETAESAEPCCEMATDKICLMYIKEKAGRFL